MADGRILHSYSLQVNESSLTGESENVNKTEEVIQQEKVALGDQVNMVFSSSLVTYGRAIVVVTQTGMGTELGKIASLMNATKEKKTPLQVTLDSFRKKAFHYDFDYLRHCIQLELAPRKSSNGFHHVCCGSGSCSNS